MGSTFRQAFHTSGGKVDLLCEVTGYEENRRLSLSYAHEGASFLIDFLFEPQDGGTRLVASGDGQVTGFYKLFEPLVQEEINAKVGSSLTNLKELLEART